MQFVPQEKLRAAKLQAEINDWRTKFAANIRDISTIRETWQEIEHAGIAGEAAWLLYWYAKGLFAVEELSRRNRKAVEVSRSSLRAIVTANNKHRDPRAAMFVERARTKIIAAANMPWINPYSACQTFADAAAIGVIGNPATMAKRGEAIRRSGTMDRLLILQLYAAKRGVQLGLKRLTALARCAERPPANNEVPRQEDEKTLSRFFNRRDVKRAGPDLLANFERHLPERSLLKLFAPIL